MRKIYPDMTKHWSEKSNKTLVDGVKNRMLLRYQIFPDSPVVSMQTQLKS